jgi:hypothetical protein
MTGAGKVRESLESGSLFFRRVLCLFGGFVLF